MTRPKRVTYSFNRPVFDKYDVIDCDLDSSLLYNFFLTKSNDWIYEKEHRSILPLYFSDKIITKSNQDIFDTVNQSTGINVRLVDKGQCEITFDKDCLVEDRRSIGEYIALTDNNAMFLYSVNESSVTCIYLGCKVTDYEASLVLDAIKENGNFPDTILVKRALLSIDRYNLDFESISYPILYRI